MANKRIPGLDPLGGGAVANDDSFIVFDTSTDTTKRIIKSEFVSMIGTSLSGTYLLLTGGSLTGALSIDTSTSGNGLYVAQAGTGPAVKITNTGTGASLLVEDAASTDTTPFIVDNTGRVGIGTTTPLTSLYAATTDAAKVPTGTTAERPSGLTGYLRFNTDLVTFEGHNGTAWGEIGGGGARGGGLDKVFYENDQTVTANYTITAGKNAGSFGPITVNGGVTVTVPSGSTWTIV